MTAQQIQAQVNEVTQFATWLAGAVFLLWVGKTIGGMEKRFVNDVLDIATPESIPVRIPQTTPISDEQLLADRQPIPFTPVKRLMRDDLLYVTEETRPHPIHGYAEAHKEYAVIDLRGYRRGYEPRLDIRGIYTPNAGDVFRLGTGHLPSYQPTATGDKLLEEMRRRGVHKAWRIRAASHSPQTKVVTVTCPICGKVIEIPNYNAVSRSEALRRHMEKEHTSSVGLHPQALAIEGGELLPWRDRHLVDPLPLPESALSVEYLPAIQVEPGETKTGALLRKLKDGVQRIQTSDELRNYLIAMSRFYNYSWNNQLLIMLQRPDATHVAGFNTWKDLGRWVKKGEAGIAIFAPRFRAADVTWVRHADGERWRIQRLGEEWGIFKEDHLVGRHRTKGEAERQLRMWGATEERVAEAAPRFIVVHVFDIAQTEGKPLPEFAVPVLNGEVNEELFVSLRALMKQRGVAVSFESRPHMDPAIKGQYQAPDQSWVRPEEPPAQQLKTLLHEIAHYYSEGVFRIPRRDAETIAESAAYVVGAHYDFDTGTRSFPYVALWAQDEKVLSENLAAIQRVSNTILEEMEKVK